MAKEQFKNYLWCIMLLFIAGFSFFALFIVDVVFFQVKETIFTALYGYGLFPVFSLIYGYFSYKKTKKIILPNILYFLFCITFIILFIKIGSAYINTSASVILQQSKLAIGVIGIVAAISIIVSSIMSIMTAIIIKLIRKNTENGSSTGNSSIR